jgi:triacylglycerol lipase
LDAAAETGYAEIEGFAGKEYQGNDGLVSVSSARWGEFLGTVDRAHHWELRGEGGLFPQVGSNKPSKQEEDQVAKAKNPEAPSKASWDLAQVGQVVDWVSDLLPDSDGKQVGKKQLRDAQIEKDRENTPPSPVSDKTKEKFDLGRFYGGLMLKLKRDGF